MSGLDVRKKKVEDDLRSRHGWLLGADDDKRRDAESAIRSLLWVPSVFAERFPFVHKTWYSGLHSSLGGLARGGLCHLVYVSFKI